jgi:hypothetical protein
MTRWRAESVDDAARTLTVEDGPRTALDRATVFERWRTDSSFVAGFVEALAAIEFDAFVWETPPVTRNTLRRRFEFTVTTCPALVRPPDPSPFRDRFAGATGEAVVRFTNLGGDADLVVPTPGPPGERMDGSHLAAFARSAPLWRQRALWRAVAQAMAARVSARPVWLSTSGLGVAWLHVRLDERPKYYEHGPYRRPPAN